MNRTIILVKDPHPPAGFRYGLITLHWEYGDSVKTWLNDSYPDYRSAWSLIEQGHRSTIAESRKDLGIVNHCEYANYRTLREAREEWEHYTFAYHNGKVWKFGGDR